MPTYQNFNVGWAENDGDLTHTATRSTWTSMRRDASAWFVKDFGAGYFSTFICGCTLRLTDMNPDSSTWRMNALSWMNVIDDWQGNKDELGVRILGSVTAGKFRIGIVENNGAGNASSPSLEFNENQDYYIIFRKIGTLTILELYSDKDHSALVGYTSLTMRNAVAFRYMHAPVSLFFGGDPADYASGYVEYLTLDPQFGRDLAARFEVGQGSANLKAGFESQAILNLLARFEVGQGSQDLLAEFISAQWQENLKAGFITGMGESWLAGYIRRKGHKITGSSTGTVTDYAVKVVVHYGPGVDSGEDVYLNSRCQTDFGDIRFTSWDGITELDYWLQIKTDSSQAIFWVEVDRIPLDPAETTIYIYYHTPGTSVTTQDGDATWIDYDQMDDLNAWGDGGLTKMHTSAEQVYGGHGSNSAKKDDGDTDLIAKDYGAELANRRVLIFFYDSATIDTPPYQNAMGIFNAAFDYCHIGIDSPTSQVNYSFRTDVGGFQDSGIARITNAWHEGEFLVLPADVDIILDGVLVGNSAIAGMRYVYHGCWWVGSEDGDLYVDCHCVGKFVDPEPAHAAWEEEEELAGSASLKARFEVRYDGIVDLLAKVTIGPSASEAELLSRFYVRQMGTPLDLFAKFEIQRQNYAELYSRFGVYQLYADLLARALIRCESCTEVYGRLTVTRVGSLKFPVQFIARHSDTLNLLNRLYVRPKESTADELIIGGRDRRLDIGGVDREIIVGGRDRRMRIR